MKQLKILFVLQTPWGAGLGVSRVHYELRHEYEKLGHEVDYLDWNKLYPTGQSSYGKIFGEFYTERILDYLKNNAHNYDVIDANFNCVVYPKTAYNFKGLVIYRSHGLQPLYRQIEQSAVYKKMLNYNLKSVPFKTRIGNFYRYIQRKDGDFELFNSIKNADVIHTLNAAEYRYFKEYGMAEDKLVLVPNGVPDNFFEVSKKYRFDQVESEISFVGSWTIRKGIKDLNEIIYEIQQRISLKKIFILGGGASDEQIISSFSSDVQPLLSIKSSFDAAELPKILATCKVGIFPSYAEGFGLSIVEQLALGIPVVAYNTPGPADILNAIDYNLLIEPGDKYGFALKVAEILALPNDVYKDLVRKCIQRAKDFRMSVIAQKFVNIYYEHLEKISYV